MTLVRDCNTLKKTFELNSKLVIGTSRQPIIVSGIDYLLIYVYFFTTAKAVFPFLLLKVFSAS